MKLELQPYQFAELIPNGKIVTFETVMTPYPDKRKRLIRVWLPEDYDGVKRFPVIYMHDGQNVFAGEGNPSGKLLADRAVTALADVGFSAIIVAIDTSEWRGSELTPPYPRGERGVVVQGMKIPIIDEPSTAELYAQFIVNDLKPMIDENFLTRPDVMNTCIGGISAGGSASYYMILKFPEVFGRAIVCSPGFPMFSLEKMLETLDLYDMAKLADHRIAFYNGDQSIDATSLDYVLAVYRKLRAKGMDSLHNMFLLDTRQTHYEAAWAKYLPEILRFLFLEDNSQPTPQQIPQPPPTFDD